MTETAVRLTFPAKADYLLLARLALSGVARSLPVDDNELADLKLAVTEACGNAIRHAYGPEGGPVSVEFLVVDGDTLQITVRDDGEGISLPASLDGDEPELLQAMHEGPLEGGMGMPIIRAIVDELEVGSGSDGRGTVVRMVKRLSPTA